MILGRFCCLLVTFLLCQAVSSRLMSRFKNRIRMNSTLCRDLCQPSSHWFTQDLDHFQPTDGRRWKQRYGVLKDFYKPGGPVFLMIGGEGPEPPEDMALYAWIDYAAKHNAFLFDVEHRFYGESIPSRDLSVENLRYLSSEQALADLASFIVAMNKRHELPADTKWIAFGGSYPGNLAAWLRYKYPHLVHAAVASSAPVLAQVDFQGAMDILVEDLAEFGDSCVEAVKAAVGEVQSLVKTPDGLDILYSTLRVKVPFGTTDVQTLTEMILNVMMNSIQRSGRTAVVELCKLMVDEKLGSPLQRLGLYNSDWFMENNYEDLLEYYRYYGYNDGGSVRQWVYQTCTELGYFHTSERKEALFGQTIPVDMYLKQCKDIFGPDFTKEMVYRAVQRTNMMYGGLDIKATRVVYIHGSEDPWHGLGITETRIPESPVIFINGTTHCADMHPPRDSDPPALKAAREQITSLIGKWLQEQ